MRWFPVAFLTNGVFLKVTHGGIELTTPVLGGRLLNHYATLPLGAKIDSLSLMMKNNNVMDCSDGVIYCQKNLDWFSSSISSSVSRILAKMLSNPSNGSMVTFFFVSDLNQIQFDLYPMLPLTLLYLCTSFGHMDFSSAVSLVGAMSFDPILALFFTLKRRHPLP